MRLPPLNYRSLLILYGSSAATVLPFAVVYLYAHVHGWNHVYLLPFLFIAGIAAAILIWARLEPRLLAHQPPMINLNAVAPEKIFSAVLATSIAVTVFAPPIVIMPFCGTAKRTATSSSMLFEVGIQSDVSLQQQDAVPVTSIVR